jgi:hypothetical protein
VLATLLLAAAIFTPAPGWHTGVGRVHACSGERASCRYVNSWAATVRWRDCPECLPHRTVARLTPDGIALQLQLSRERDPPNWMRPLAWPPRIHSVSAPFEGLPQRIGVYQKIGFVHGYTVSLFAFFGRPQPTPRQLSRARAELATVKFPPR